MAVSEATKRRFKRNQERARALIGLSQFLLNTAAEDEMASDVLRAATVLLHATLDDFVRTVAKEHWQNLSKERLKLVPLPQRKPGEKISFVDLLSLQGRGVTEIVQGAVHEFLDTTSFNQKHHVTELLDELGVPRPGPKSNDLKPLMRRRHHIVHQADKAEPQPGSPEVEQPIVASEVELWADAVDYLYGHVVQHLT